MEPMFGTSLSDDTGMPVCLMHVEMCTADREGSSSLRGSAERYKLVFSKLCFAFETAFQDCLRKVVVNDRQPRLGAFEVSFALGSSPATTIFSKLLTLKWPCIKILVARMFAQLPLAQASLLRLGVDATDAHRPAEASLFHSQNDSTAAKLVGASKPTGAELAGASNPSAASSPSPQAQTPRKRMSSRRQMRPFTCVHVARPHSAPPLRPQHGASPLAKKSKRLGLQLIGMAFDERLLRCGVAQILAIGDCHGGRTIAHLSRLVQTHFIYGCMFSWASGKRTLPPLQSLLLPARQALSGSGMRPEASLATGSTTVAPPMGATVRANGEARWSAANPPCPAPAVFNKAVAIFSYGTRDCRLHASKWIGHPEDICEPYVVCVLQYTAAAAGRGARVIVPIILAVPPAVDYSAHQPDVEAHGDLGERVHATELLNEALARACDRHGVLFSGVDTWEFARSASGTLKPELSTSGHSSIDPSLCAPVHQLLRRMILRAVGDEGEFDS